MLKNIKQKKELKYKNFLSKSFFLFNIHLLKLKKKQMNETYEKNFIYDYN